MKRKLYIAFFLAPLIIVLAFFLIGAQSGRQVNGVDVNSAPQFSEQGRDVQSSIVPGIVMVKIKSHEVAQSLTKATTMTGLASLDAKLATLGAISVKKAFRHKPIPLNSNIPDISRILKVQIPDRLNPIIIAKELSRDLNVEYAEPVYERRLCAVPNDPMYSQQQHLPQIHAPEAWDVQKGDSTVIIGIVDTGVDYLHEDLAANVWTNEAEANGVTGVDDDNNGFVDDIHGWDFGDNDNDPMDPLTYGHGTHCAGIACAVTNNGIGVAGVSWNCKYLPIKVFPDDGKVTDRTPHFAGIVYAADNGADIISNSWGLNQYLKWEQDVINYAHGKGAIVVCAAMNIDSEIPMYPASYQNAISVAAVDITDHKTSYSSFGAWVDICAPGGVYNAEILSTVPGNKYANKRGTSMATPVIAGVFGLVKSQHPDWSNDQIVRQVLLTADDIDALNPQYTDRFGYGRVNAARAVTVNPNDLLEPEARLAVFSLQIDDSLSGDGDGVLDRGETIQLNCEIQNCSIGSASATTLQLTCTNADVQILDGIKGPLFFPPDSIQSFAFTFRIAEQAAAHASELVLKMKTDGGYYREEKIPISVGLMPMLFVDYDLGEPISTSFPEVDPVYRDILNKNNLLFGYWDIDMFGFPEKSTLVKFPFVIVAASSPKFWEFVLGEQARDNLRSYLNGGGHLFICGQDVGVHLFEVEGTEESKAFMRDYLHAEYIANDSQNHNVSGVTNDPISQNLSFHVWQPVLRDGWQCPDVIAPTAGASTIFTYSDGRTGAVKYAGDHKVVYLGFGGLEAVDSDVNTQIGDTSSIRTELFLRILNWLNFIEHEPLQDTDNVDSSRSVIARITGNVTDLQAVTLFWRLQGDVNFTSVTMSKSDSGYYATEIPAPGKATKVEYYLQAKHPYYEWCNPIGAPDIVYSYQVGTTDVQEIAALPLEFQLAQNYPNPFNPSTTIEFALPKSAFVTLKVYNLLGEKVATLIAEQRSAGIHKFNWDARGLASGVYLYRLEAGNPSMDSGQVFVQIKKLVLIR